MNIDNPAYSPEPDIGSNYIDSASYVSPSLDIEGQDWDDFEDDFDEEFELDQLCADKALFNDLVYRCGM